MVRSQPIFVTLILFIALPSTTMNKSLVCRNQFLWMTSVCSREDCTQQTIEGTYQLKFSAGNQTIPGTLHLVWAGNKLAGKLEVRTPRNLVYLAIQTDKPNGQPLEFSVSSPGVKFTLEGPDSSIAGTLFFQGNRKFQYAGKKVDSVVEERLKTTIEQLPLYIKNQNYGSAFSTISTRRRYLAMSTYTDDFTKQVIKMCELKSGQAGTMHLTPFSGTFSDRAPFFSPDGEWLYFSSTRPVGDEMSAGQDYNLWRVSFKEGTFGQPEVLSELNSEANDYQPCVTNKGIYFVSERQGGKGGQDIYFASRQGSRFGIPVNVSEVNSSESEISAFVDPDETLMILATSSSLTTDHQGNDDLYLLSRVDNGWRNAVNLGPGLNSFANEYGAFLSGNKKSLFFTSDVLPPGKLMSKPFK